MEQAAHQEKSHAALSSVLWSAFLTVIKLWAGIVTGSLGIISEALHSGLDLMAAAMTFYAVKVASRPADESHPYGHEKVENLSALAETALLLVTCAWIVWEAVDRLFYNEAEITLTWWAFAVVAVSLLVDVNRSAMLRRVAKKHKSQALEADALHFTTDIWSSAVVLLGLFCIWLAHLVPAEGSSWGAGAAGSAAAGAAAGAGAASAARDAFFLLPESKSRASFLTGAGREGAGAGAGWGARFFLEDPPIRSNTSFLGSFSSCLLGILI